MTNRMVIIGTGGFAKELLWLARECRAHDEAIPEVIGFLASKTEATTFQGLPVLGNDDWAYHQLDREVFFTLGMGNAQLRRTLAKRYEQWGFKPVSLIHPSAHYSKAVKIGAGSLLCSGVKLTVDIDLGRHCLLNLQATVGHDVKLFDYTVIHPGAHISGACQVGEASEIGTGAVLLPERKVGKNCRV
ncbi:MAG: hypothetical protein AAFP92_28515, partial [Bacteroidota bacterium]